AHQLVETIRSEVKDEEVVVTPETLTSYTYDAAGRTLSVRRDIGAMTTTESTEYDTMGRVTKQVDVLGRETTTEYSVDGLTTTTTTPAGATFITVTNPDGSTKEISGTGQRAQQYSYDINGKNIATTVRLMNNAILSQNIVNGFGQTVVQTSPATNNRFIYTRSEYNSKGQMIKQYRDTCWNTTSTAPTLYEYDVFGNVVKQTLALSDSPTKDDSPVIEMAYSVESMEDGVYRVTIQTRYNAVGQPLNSTQKQLVSQLSGILSNKSIGIDVRGNSSVRWAVYTAPTKVTSYNSIPTSDITAETIKVDGFAISKKDHVGIITTTTRSYTTSGMTMVQVNGRGNATTIKSDLAGRTISLTDAAGASTTTIYDIAHNQPSAMTDAMGNTACYKYDLRGRKIAEWGTALQPACFGYDEADNLISLKTFRAGTEIISSDPTERMDGDETTWVFDPATGLELSKTYANNSSVVKTYDAYNRLATETDARGNVKTHSYEHVRGLLMGTTYSDGTTAKLFAYNHLGQVTQVTDDAGIRSIGYNAYGEQETDTLLADEVTHLITET
ncbi:MAG: RHS repeat protein, partial [Akkermansia sp.]|nr:RHS repeat protein [Akkermansia sp.]